VAHGLLIPRPRAGRFVSPLSRIAITPQVKTAAPAVTPPAPDSADRESGRRPGGSRPRASGYRVGQCRAATASTSKSISGRATAATPMSVWAGGWPSQSRRTTSTTVMSLAGPWSTILGVDLDDVAEAQPHRVQGDAQVLEGTLDLLGEAGRRDLAAGVGAVLPGDEDELPRGGADRVAVAESSRVMQSGRVDDRAWHRRVPPVVVPLAVVVPRAAPAGSRFVRSPSPRS